MNKVRITVGGDIEKDASRRFARPWRSAAQGKTVRERHLAFESWAALSRVLTGKRLELLHHVRHHKVASVRALPKAPDRDYSNVHADVRALAEAGLLDLEKDGMRADYDAIETRVTI